jgi:hypothetical protein
LCCMLALQRHARQRSSAEGLPSIQQPLGATQYWQLGGMERLAVISNRILLWMRMSSTRE